MCCDKQRMLISLIYMQRSVVLVQTVTPRYSSFSFPHTLTACLRQTEIVFFWECVIYTTAPLLNPTVFVKRVEQWCQKRSQFAQLFSFVNLFVCVIFSCHVHNWGQNLGHCIIKGTVVNSVLSFVQVLFECMT